MVKIKTPWRTSRGSDTLTTDNEGAELLLETGSNLLLETGDKLILEDAVLTQKPATEWSESA